ncbi:hypothetical protein ACIRG4_17355 [Streptomyces sp. NPDC102395]|uniref:hypothetical protein n=1 Tax=Streptomyces sp. NPDC102395 TaxID=3366168 RepID=UPI0038100EC1
MGQLDWVAHSGAGGEAGEVLGLDDPVAVGFGKAGEDAGQGPLAGDFAAVARIARHRMSAHAVTSTLVVTGDERWDAVMFNPDRTVGAIVISHRGCALRSWLVISGAHRDTIWTDDRADEADLAPLRSDDGTPVTFARWYTDWLSHAERTALGAI